jgi:beta-glucosidase
VCDILLGKKNPSAKLTASWPRCEGQIPVYYACKHTGRPVESKGTIQFNQAHRSAYLDETNAPLFPFGYGLSYTQFTYSNLEISTLQIEQDGSLKVSVAIENTGHCTGKEIVQLYVQDCCGVVTRPVKELKGFQKIELLPGEKRKVCFELPVTDLAFLDVELHSVIEPGELKVWISPNSSEGLAGSFEIV